MSERDLTKDEIDALVAGSLHRGVTIRTWQNAWLGYSTPLYSNQSVSYSN